MKEIAIFTTGKNQEVCIRAEKLVSVFISLQAKE
jgi:hypothetical protein